MVQEPEPFMNSQLTKNHFGSFIEVLFILQST